MNTCQDAETLLSCLKFSILLLRSPRLCRTQRVVGNILVHSITREIETADHVALLSDTRQSFAQRRGNRSINKPRDRGTTF